MNCADPKSLLALKKYGSTVHVTALITACFMAYALSLELPFASGRILEPNNIASAIAYCKLA